MSVSRDQLEKWVKTIDVKTDKVLDIGGSQLPIKDRVNSFEVKDYKIMDLEVPHECKQKPDIIQDIQEEMFEYDKFDVIFCLEVSEYWYDPHNAIKNIFKILNNGGVLYCSFHFVYPIHNPEGLDYLRYTRWGVETLLSKAGFIIEEIIPRVNERASYQAYCVAEGMRPCKTYDNHEETGYLIKAKKI